MIPLEEARARAGKVLDELGGKVDVELAIVDEATRDAGWCWVFFYNSRKYLITGAVRDALAGNGPIVVEKATGLVHRLTAARPLDEQLGELR